MAFQTILTKFIPATAHRYARIRAVQSGWSEKTECESVTVEYRHRTSNEESHWQAAKQLAQQLGWTGRYVAGSLGAWSEFQYVFVRPESEHVDGVFEVDYPS